MTQVPETDFGRLVAGLSRAFAQGDADYLNKAREAANVDLLRSVYTHLLEGRPNDFIECLASDVSLEIRGMPAWNGRSDGKEAVMAAIGRNFSALAEQHPVIVSLVAQGDDVVLMLEEQGRFAADGAAYHVMATQWFTFRDAKIVRIREIVGAV